MAPPQRRAAILREQLHIPGTCWRPLRRFLAACLRDVALATPAISTPHRQPPPQLGRRRFPLAASPLPNSATSTDRPSSSLCPVVPLSGRRWTSRTTLWLSFPLRPRRS